MLSNAPSYMPLPPVIIYDWWSKDPQIWSGIRQDLLFLDLPTTTQEGMDL